jgi:pilus assembly protein Flp/PilA
MLRRDLDFAAWAQCGRRHANRCRLGSFASMKNLAARFINDESGATAIEYGLIAAGISVVIIATVQALGTQLNTTFTKVKDELAKTN